MSKVFKSCVSLIFSVFLFSSPAFADFDTALDAYKNGDIEAAFAEWKSMADTGDARAQRVIGNLYLNGEGRPANPKKAAQYYELSAVQGDVEAQLSLGTLYREGIGVAQDYDQALHWLYKAAQAGHPLAQYDLAEIFYTGEGGVMQERHHSHDWYRLAAKKGVIIAQVKLAQMLLEGISVKKDELVGMMWLDVAGLLAMAPEVPPISERVFPLGRVVQTDKDKRTLLRIIFELKADYEERLPSALLTQAQQMARAYDPEMY